MKKFAWCTLLCLIPILGGIVCFIVGNTTGNSTVTYAGMLALLAGLPVCMVILLLIGLIRMSRGKRGNGGDPVRPKGEQTQSAAPNDEANAADKTSSGETEKEVLSPKKHEREAINAVNRASHFESRVRLANYEIRNVTEGMKHASKRGIAIGLTFFFLLVADLIVVTVLLIQQIFVGAIVCAVLLGVVLITAVVVISIRRAKAMRGDLRKAEKITEGKVKACFTVGMFAMRTGGDRYRRNSKTARIKSITYKVIVIADGEEYDAFSKRFYEIDETVTVAVMGKKRAIIADDACLEKIKSE